jgi:hypothetical protein
MKRYLTMASTYHMRRADVLLTIDGACWRLKIARRSSRLDHYYHFITDFVWPIYSWSTKMRPGGGIAFSDCVTLNPQPLHFRQLIHEIFGVRLRGVKLHSGVARSAFIRNTARMSGFNPRWRGYLDFFENIDAARDDLRRFNEHLDMTFARSPSRRPTLVLIEREAGNTDRGAPCHL